MADAFGIAWSLVKAGVAWPKEHEGQMHDVATEEERDSGVQAQDFTPGHPDIPGALGHTASAKASHGGWGTWRGAMPPARSYVHPDEIIANIVGLNDISELDRNLTPQEDIRAVQRVGEVSSHEAVHQALRQHKPERGLHQVEPGVDITPYSDEFAAALGEASANFQGEDNTMRQAQPKRHLNHLHGIMGGRGGSASFTTNDPEAMQRIRQRKAMLASIGRGTPQPYPYVGRSRYSPHADEQEIREHLGRRARSNARRRGGSPEGSIWEEG